jgi:hypothetical protein
MKVTVGCPGYVAAVRAACIGSHGRDLPALVFLMSPALACALERGQVGVPGVVSGAQASVGSGLGVPAQ